MKKIAIIIPLGLTLVFLLLFTMKIQPPQAALAASPVLTGETDQAHIAVRFGDNRQLIRTISFTAPVSGLQALELTGLEVITKESGFGISMCSIGGVGCPASDCFCDSRYWSYSYWDGSQWQAYMVGADASSIADGAIDGWSWQEWGAAKLPPATSLLAASNGLEWLATRQNSDGGYVTQSSSAESLLSIGANQINAADWRLSPGGSSLLGYFVVNAPAYVSGAGQSGKLAVGMSGAQGCWTYGTKKPMDFYNPLTGEYASYNFDHAYAMLGTIALGQSVPPTATQHLKDQIQPNGGWEWSQGWGTDTNSTAIAIQALIAAGSPLSSSEIISGLAYLKNAQNTDGGFPYAYPDLYGDGSSDTNSTAYVVQSILAAGQDPQTGTWVISGTNPIHYLTSRQLPDGSFEFKPALGSNLYATQQAIPTLIGIYYPLAVQGVEFCPYQMLPAILR